jgi:hypothetical protein
MAAGLFPKWLIERARKKLNELQNSACDPPENEYPEDA